MGRESQLAGDLGDASRVILAAPSYSENWRMAALQHQRLSYSVRYNLQAPSSYRVSGEQQYAPVSRSIEDCSNLKQLTRTVALWTDEDYTSAKALGSLFVQARPTSLLMR
jgi:hypothetical protein